jgi:predicted transposase/invertase (TIGR01784 family)
MRYDKNWDRISNERTLLYETKLKGLIEGREEGRIKGEEIGLQKGEEIGIKKGKESGMKKVASNMKKKGMPLDDISELTGLSKEEIEAL